MPKKEYTGTVVSDKMDKTVVVAVTRLAQHPVYKKIVKKVTKFKAHDEENRCRVGDRVSIIETRPLSKEKRWAVLKIIGQGEGSKGT
jgi:small subunit ribosomal protein S17